MIVTPDHLKICLINFGILFLAIAKLLAFQILWSKSLHSKTAEEKNKFSKKEMLVLKKGMFLQYFYSCTKSALRKSI